MTAPEALVPGHQRRRLLSSSQRLSLHSLADSDLQTCTPHRNTRTTVATCTWRSWQCLPSRSTTALAPSQSSCVGMHSRLPDKCYNTCWLHFTKHTLHHRKIYSSLLFAFKQSWHRPPRISPTGGGTHMVVERPHRSKKSHAGKGTHKNKGAQRGKGATNMTFKHDNGQKFFLTVQLIPCSPTFKIMAQPFNAVH